MAPERPVGLAVVLRSVKLTIASRTQHHGTWMEFRLVHVLHSLLGWPVDVRQFSRHKCLTTLSYNTYAALSTENITQWSGIRSTLPFGSARRELPPCQLVQGPAALLPPGGRRLKFLKPNSCVRQSRWHVARSSSNDHESTCERSLSASSGQLRLTASITASGSSLPT